MQEFDIVDDFSLWLANGYYSSRTKFVMNGCLLLVLPLVGLCIFPMIADQDLVASEDYIFTVLSLISSLH